MRTRIILAAALALGVFMPSQASTGVPQQAQLLQQSLLTNDCPNYYQCLLNCPYKYTDPAACEYICQAEVCEAP
jgi:hypothetical protein